MTMVNLLLKKAFYKMVGETVQKKRAFTALP